MVSVWSYPWCLLSGNPDTTFDELASRGITEITVAAHYHSIQTLGPRTPDSLFESYEGGCYFEPNLEDFTETPIDPPVNHIEGYPNPLQTITEYASKYGMNVNAWVVCFHNSKLGLDNPQYRIQSVFGDTHEHAFCPSHSEVRTYFEAVTKSLAAYDINAINLESLGFPNVFHTHGATFGHSKNHVVRGSAEELLLSQCFCPACMAEAEDHHVDMEHAKATVQELSRRVLEDPSPQITSLADITDRYPELMDLFDFRASVIDGFLQRLAQASGEVALTYSASDGLGRNPNDGWPAGVQLDRIESSLDRIISLCYTGDRDIARERVNQYREAVDIPVDAGFSLDPEIIGSKRDWESILKHAGSLGEKIHVYNHALMTDAHLDWLQTSFAKPAGTSNNSQGSLTGR
ncbi:hypothetical protein [Haloprofundus marisrubri]|uniref:hypothetical protein n=1 Tax=Haloprofundus marisrubri TaxID=1514971 RepID=UPI0009E4B5B4|nr:hypothetical protein [Haloprofundus marisrubri]